MGKGRRVVGKKGRRGWGRIRRLPSSGRYQANYVGPDRVRHNALMTFEAKIDAEAWLAAERRSIERDEWQPPSLRVAEKKAKESVSPNTPTPGSSTATSSPAPDPATTTYCGYTSAQCWAGCC